MSEPTLIQLSASESRLVLQAVSIAVEHECKALERCRQERPSPDVQQSIRERQAQIDKFERLRKRIGEQL